MFRPPIVTDEPEIVRLDMNESCQPDLLCDLDKAEWCAYANTAAGKDAVTAAPFRRMKNEYFHEVHAYEVLEHLGSQGDYRSFFDSFHNIYDLLVPGGYLCATVPSRYSAWLWGDPGHRRAVLPESLVFLDQGEYAKQCGITAMSDYRFYYKDDFKAVSGKDDRSTFSFILQAIKPSRIKST
jgi:hypothetical protein